MNTRLTQTSEQPSSILYARLLGPAWLKLSPSVQNLHQASTALYSRFEVCHGSSVASLLARWLKLPKPATSVDLTLIIERSSQAEKWIRRFGNATITTIQWAGGNHLLRERFGMVELGFELRIENGGLIYHQRQAALRVGRSSLRIPLWLAPHVNAVERPSSDSDHVEVSVEVRLPALGLLIAYRGSVLCSAEVLR